MVGQARSRVYMKKFQMLLWAAWRKQKGRSGGGDRKYFGCGTGDIPAAYLFRL